VSPQLERIAEKAKAEPKLCFTALAHHLTEEFLRETWQGLNKKGAAGVDGISVAEYAEDLEGNIHQLVERLKAHSYQAPQVRRVHIPKAGNPAKLRPLGIPTVEDRLLQAAVARLLGPIYEADFLDCSYGFRPGRTAHEALAEVRKAVLTGEAQWVAEADIKAFFDHLDHAWLMRMLKLRIGDPWILRLIGKWLKAGILDQGQVTTPEEGTPQGGPLSPLLANIYLHYVLDLWFTLHVRPRCTGPAKLVRFADDYVVLFAEQKDAERFTEVLPKRLGKFGLSLAEEKTALVPFGRKHWRAGQSHPHHFDLLGFRHHLGTDRKGRMAVIRIPGPKSVRKFLGNVKQWLRTHRHDRPSEQQRVLSQKLRGYYQYFALWHTMPKLQMVAREVRRQWKATLQRRSQRGRRLTWEAWKRKAWFDLPQPRLLHRTV
jgi:RNA-directed DNA polymerase